MDELDDDQTINLTGTNPTDLSAMLNIEFGEETTKYLAQWTKITQLSLKANRLIIKHSLKLL